MPAIRIDQSVDCTNCRDVSAVCMLSMFMRLLVHRCTVCTARLTLCCTYRQYRMLLHPLVSYVGTKQSLCPTMPLNVHRKSTPVHMEADVFSWTLTPSCLAVKTACFSTFGHLLMLTFHLLILMWWWTSMMEVWWQAAAVNVVSCLFCWWVEFALPCQLYKGNIDCCKLLSSLWKGFCETSNSTDKWQEICHPRCNVWLQHDINL